MPPGEGAAKRTWWSMSIQIETEDREFVTSTGANASPNSRTTPFDGAPEASTGLVISAQSGDPDPRLFEVGDRYDIRWDGGRIDDAEVVRSDAVGEGGIVGFSGLDENGDPALVLWTPDFDLQGWYDSVRGQASFYTSDRQASYTHSYMCFAAEARIATPYGPMPVGCLRPGHRVMTRDHGPRVLRWVGQKRVEAWGAAAPVLFAPGTIGNHASLRLSQQHRVLISAPQMQLMFDTSEVLVPAKALVGRSGIQIVPAAAVTYVHLMLDAHEIIDAEGAACESLFMGPVSSGVLDGDPFFHLTGEQSAIRHARSARPLLTYQEARAVLGIETDFRVDKV